MAELDILAGNAMQTQKDIHHSIKCKRLKGHHASTLVMLHTKHIIAGIMQHDGTKSHLETN